MAKMFKSGDHVSWNSEVGRVSGRILKVHTMNVNYKGYVHHASQDDSGSPYSSSGLEARFWGAAAVARRPASTQRRITVVGERDRARPIIRPHCPALQTHNRAARLRPR
jgi:hypothetical protein